MAKPRASAERLTALAQAHEQIVGRFTTRVYVLHPDGRRVVERSPRANGRVYERILDALPHYARAEEG